jgi:hypothetical protein
MQQEQQQLHSAIKPLSWLIGKWFGKEGNCHYPTIKSIKYNEELVITHPASNQPMLHLK